MGGMDYNPIRESLEVCLTSAGSGFLASTWAQAAVKNAQLRKRDLYGLC